MPTKYKPQLDHVGFDWIKQADKLHSDLLEIEPEILEKLGFNAAFSGFPPKVVESEAREIIRELSGVLSLAAAIRMDAGFKPANKLVSTLQAIKKDPSLIRSKAIEPEALGKLALHYHRPGEKPGTFWWDVDRQDNSPLPDLEQVRAGASDAIAALVAEASPGRRPDEVTKFVALRAREMFLQFNAAVTRHSVASSQVLGGISRETQIEAGPFFEFVELLLAPLNRFFSTLSKIDYQPTPVSAATVARMAVEFESHQSQQRHPKAEEMIEAESERATQLNP